MGDVQLVTKASLTLSQGPVASDPPAFTLPPRNVRVSSGASPDWMARYEPPIVRHSAGSAHRSECECAFLQCIFSIKVLSLSQLCVGRWALVTFLSVRQLVEAPRPLNQLIG
ncbi:hypothetical protein ANANG_G00280380 [Anguilla anguilla]|uniref:Uncharacterized protein n=1 Tax=Anguilla anguilla TaxID=7936 RepID=A0A9D3LQQ0_ANGAN|nr:hypothetical protein ANANG_G00280380 [Anguilla anguilla]